jgi:hypothetical protein
VPTLFWIEVIPLVTVVRLDWMDATLLVRLVRDDEMPLTVVVRLPTEEVRPVTAVPMVPTFVLSVLTLPERVDMALFAELIPLLNELIALLTPANPLVTFLPRLEI